MTLNEFIYQLLPLLLSVITSACTLLITFLKTRQKVINNKVSKSVDLCSSNRAIDLSQFVVEINGVQYLLSELKISRR